MTRRFAFACLVALAPLPVAAHDNISSVTREGELTCIASNGTPNHDIGQFPNRANPNAFEAQSLRFCFPTEPQLADAMTTGEMTVGVTLTGLPIRPYTAGYYDPDGRRGIGRDPASGWRQQAMFEPRALGMDAENGHVDRSGLYHYHGVSPSYLQGLPDTQVGFAPDGFEIHYDPAIATSSYQLRQGSRDSGPGGAFDGMFEEDFEFVDGSGTLDACNGMMVAGTYTYFATDTYPYFPRCFRGEVPAQFMVRN